MSMHPSASCVALVKKYEGCELVAYKDSVGVWTIGYGHTGGVAPGQVITQAQADAFLEHDLAQAASIVNAALKVQVTQGMFDALTSFVFNIGPGKEGVKSGLVHLKEGGPSTLLRLVNEGRFKEAAAQFKFWTLAGGVQLQGLVDRRAHECALFGQ